MKGALLRPAAGQGRPLRRLRNRRDRGGIAIIVVIAAIMILTSVVTDLSFGARVRFLASAHERDETEAYYLAMSGVNVYRLILMANKQISKNQMICSFLASSEMGLSCQDLLVNLIPRLNTGLMRTMFVSGDDMEDMSEEEVQAAAMGDVSDEVREQSMEEVGHFGKKNFLDFDGDFLVEPRPEDCRINVNLLSKLQSGTSADENFIVMEISGLMGGQENEQFLRDRNLTARELALNLLDWVDTDSTVASGKGGYEDDFYNKLDAPYVAKNAPFDTLEEIRLVEGWQDDVYDRFGDQVTVFGNTKGKINVLCADPYVIKAILRTWCTNCTSMQDAQLEDLMERYQQYISQEGIAVSSAKAWKKVYEDEAGVTWDSKIDSYITDKNVVYTLTALGRVGDASSQVTIVVDQSSSDFGKVIYWRVD